MNIITEYNFQTFTFFKLIVISKIYICTFSVIASITTLFHLLHLLINILRIGLINTKKYEWLK